MSDSENVKTFWEELENEIGTPVEWYSLGEVLLPFREIKKNTVGLFFLTGDEFYFQTFPRNDFIRTLTNTFRKNKKGGGKVQHPFPRNTILSIDPEKPAGFLRRIFSPGMPIVTVTFKEGDILQFTLIDRKGAKELIRRLSKTEERRERDG